MPPLFARHSLQHIHAKIGGDQLNLSKFAEIITEINFGHYDAEHIAAFLTACAANGLNDDEIFYLTKAMISSGETLNWPDSIVVDKHCVGGLPGNRTTPIVVSIVAAAGLTIPKTSSRAITSASGTADTMEVFCPVDLNTKQIRRVVEQEGGCVVWGGNVGLSPVDDELVSVARALAFDGREHLVASILSKKIAAGATHVVIDLPVGPSAKIVDREEAEKLSQLLGQASKGFGLTIAVIQTDGSQPVGFGVGPALEARDVQAVLSNQLVASKELKKRALMLSAHLLEIGRKAKVGEGMALASEILLSGKAWIKFQSICEAQGGLRKLPSAKYIHPVLASKSGTVSSIDNKLISRLARLTGAPESQTGGLDLHVRIEDTVFIDQPIFTIHTDYKSRLDAVLHAIEIECPAIKILDIEERMRSFR